MNLDDLLNRSAMPVALSEDGRSELERVTRFVESQRGRLGGRRLAIWLAGSFGGALVLGGTAAAVADPFGFPPPPAPKSTHTTVVLDRVFTVDGEDHACKVTETIDIPAGPQTAAETKSARSYLHSSAPMALQPDSPILTLLLQADGKLGPIDATSYASAWGYAVMQGMTDHLSAAGLAAEGV